FVLHLCLLACFSVHRRFYIGVRNHFSDYTKAPSGQCDQVILLELLSGEPGRMGVLQGICLIEVVGLVRTAWQGIWLNSYCRAAPG
ncbi:MAG TPA: hypothetical protein VFA48_05775, partial [Gammaproteobacteria bacterium]|nr:hypothetical protein [Gammaproteobacteria bacterium]